MKSNGSLTKIVEQIVGSVCAGFLSLLIAAYVKGDQLKGLTPLASVGKLLKTGVPVWIVALLVGITAAAGIGYSRKRSKSSSGLPGLTKFQQKFAGHDYEPSMDSKDLLLVFNDGKSWVPNHREALQRRVFGRQQKVRFLMLHPRSEFLPTLVRKAHRDIREEVQIMFRSFEFLQELKDKRPDLVEIRGHFLFNPYILHLTEEIALVHPFFLNERGELPLLQFEKSVDPRLYEEYRDDAERLWETANVLTSADFAMLDASVTAPPRAARRGKATQA